MFVDGRMSPVVVPNWQTRSIHKYEAFDGQGSRRGHDWCNPTRRGQDSEGLPNPFSNGAWGSAVGDHLDSGATSQKPHPSPHAERHFLQAHQRGRSPRCHQLTEEATDAYESARHTISAFVGGQPEDLVF